MLWGKGSASTEPRQVQAGRKRQREIGLPSPPRSRLSEATCIRLALWGGLPTRVLGMGVPGCGREGGP